MDHERRIGSAGRLQRQTGKGWARAMSPAPKTSVVKIANGPYAVDEQPGVMGWTGEDGHLYRFDTNSRRSSKAAEKSRLASKLTNGLTCEIEYFQSQIGRDVTHIKLIAEAEKTMTENKTETPKNDDWCRRLRKPFPSEMIGQIPRGKGSNRVMLDYVGHAAVTDRLLDVDPNWNWEPLALDEKGRPRFEHDSEGNFIGFWIRLTVCGVTRLGYGSLTGSSPDPIKELIGDAIRNAAMRFGVALDLWIKGTPREFEGDQRTRSSQRPVPTRRPDGPMTEEQKQRLQDFVNNEKSALLLSTWTHKDGGWKRVSDNDKSMLDYVTDFLSEGTTSNVAGRTRRLIDELLAENQVIVDDEIPF